METIQLRDAIKNRRHILRSIKQGRIFIYPTDTVYGLGCDALNTDAVKKIREIKKSGRPFSVIAPSKGWITENLDVNFPEYLEKLPGPYTLIFEMKKKSVSEIVSTNTLGARIPDHPLTEIIQESGLPFVTTSCNIHGEKTITETKEIPEEIRKKIDVIIDVGKLDKQPSQVIDLTGERPVIIRK